MKITLLNYGTLQQLIKYFFIDANSQCIKLKLFFLCFYP